MGAMTANNVSFILVFLEGVLSFFSPCVIPLIPVYMSYLTGSAQKTREGGIIAYERKKVLYHTLFFILGISITFFILGMSFSGISRFFGNNRQLFAKIGGILIIILGLFQLGVINFSFLQKERKIHIPVADKEVNPLMAFVMGFTFSFAWTPCIGPALSSVLIMASGAETKILGNVLVLVYAIGFLIPFLLLGLFTTQVLNFLKAKQKLLKYAIKTGGILLITMGVITFTGYMNGLTGKQNGTQQNGSTQRSSDDKQITDSAAEEAKESDTDTEKISDTELQTSDFTLMDQYGKQHTLSEYKGKVIFLNFWATWCPPCNKELPDIESLYQEYKNNEEDVIILGVANPRSKKYPNNTDIEKEEIISFLGEGGYTFPTVFDETGEVFNKYNIYALPTTVILDKEGSVVKVHTGMMTGKDMQGYIKQVLENTK